MDSDSLLSALVKVIGVGSFGTLLQKELERRKMCSKMFTATGMAEMTGMAGMAGMAWQQGDDMVMQ